MKARSIWVPIWAYARDAGLNVRNWPPVIVPASGAGVAHGIDPVAEPGRGGTRGVGDIVAR